MAGVFNDEFDGVGGSYIVDPKTGKRVRVEEATPDAAPAQEPPKRAKQKLTESEE